MQELMPRLDEMLKVDSDPITALKAQELQINTRRQTTKK